MCYVKLQEVVSVATFRDRFIYLRKRSGFSQQEMAEVLSAISNTKISRTTVSMWEAGHRMPSRESLEAIADHFNVPMDYLLGREDDPTSAPELTPEITMIGRASKKMTPEQRKQMISVLKAMFPEEFAD